MANANTATKGEAKAFLTLAATASSLNQNHSPPASPLPRSRADRVKVVAQW
jgi:hypothetical protein